MICWSSADRFLLYPTTVLRLRAASVAVASVIFNITKKFNLNMISSRAAKHEQRINEIQFNFITGNL